MGVLGVIAGAIIAVIIIFALLPTFGIMPENTLSQFFEPFIGFMKAIFGFFS